MTYANLPASSREPGQTIKAVAFKPGFPLSGVSSYSVPTLPRPVIVSAFVTTDTRGRLDPDQTIADARLIVITVAE